MVDREVDGQHVFSLILFFDIFDGWSIVKLTGLCGWSWAALGPLRAVLGRSWGLYRRSWLHLGGSWGLCWRSWAALGPLLAVLGRSWGRCVRSWAALGAYVGGLGPLLGPMLAVLGRSWGLCWRSWALLGRKVALARAGRRSGQGTRSS